MARLSPARRVALELAGECRQRHARARDLMRGSSAMDGLSPRDRALATRLVLGTQRARGLLDATIESHLTRGHLEPRLRDALRISTFEVLCLQTPTRAAVSQGVELAALASRRARGLANAVLRRIASEDLPRMDAARSRLSEKAQEDTAPAAEDVALVAAVPLWLARALVESLGAGACAFALAAMEPPVPTVAANLNLGTAESASTLLEDAGLGPRPLPWPGCLALGRQAGLASSGLVESVRVLPADPAAQVVSWLAAPSADAESMLEVGQGRATKTILLAGANAALGGRVGIVSVDSVEFKAKLARERTQRGGLANRAQTVVLDGARLASPDVPEALRRDFPHVFVDAPCSGTGTMRRHPEVAWSLERASVLGPAASLPELQLKMLAAASKRVAPDGTLAYSTCSDLRMEDEDVVRAFLESDAGRGFELVPVTQAPCVASLPEAARAVLRGMADARGFLHTEGGAALGLDCDGHFLALMRRVR